MKCSNKDKGITLIVLVITIIILLILVGLTIVSLTKSDLYEKTILSKNLHIKSEMKEQLHLSISDLEIEHNGTATLANITQDWANEKLKNYNAIVIEDISMNIIKVTMEKSEVIGEYIIDDMLNITEITYNTNIEFSYEVETRIDDNLKIIIRVKDPKNGIEKIKFQDQDDLICNGNKEIIEIDYLIKMGKEYKIKVISTTGEEKDEILCIDKYYYSIIYSEGIKLSNSTSKIEYNKPFKSMISIEEGYQLLEISAKMGNEVIPIDMNTMLIDIENVTGDIEILAKTIYGITIDAIDILDIYSTPYCNDKNLAIRYLFDGIINYGNLSSYKGILFDNVNSFIEITVHKNVKIHAYGLQYSDSGGTSGKDIIIKKYNGTNYEFYKQCKTYTDGQKYELVILEPGKYRLFSQSRYVNFSEWETEKVIEE